MTLRKTLAIFRARGTLIAALLLTVYAPYYAAYKATIALGLLPTEAADMLFGLVGGLLGPLANAALIHVASHALAGVKVGLREALRAGASAWSRLLAAYISIGFVMIGYLAVTVLPGGLLMLVLDLKNPYLLIPFGVVGLVWGLPAFAFVEGLVVTEKLTPWHARQTSRLMTKGRRARITALGLATLVVPVGVELTQMAYPEAPFAVEVLLGLAVSWLYMVATVVCYVLYADARAERAGSNLEEA